MPFQPRINLRRIKAGSLTLSILALIALILALALVAAYYRDDTRPLRRPAPRLSRGSVRAVGGVSPEQAEATTKHVFAVCPLLAQGFGEMHDLEVGPVEAISDDHRPTRLELRFTAPAAFSLLPEGMPRDFASNQTCRFLVDPGRHVVETLQPDCDLICTASLPVQIAGARYDHSY